MAQSIPTIPPAVLFLPVITAQDTEDRREQQQQPEKSLQQHVYKEPIKYDTPEIGTPALILMLALVCLLIFAIQRPTQ